MSSSKTPTKSVDDPKTLEPTKSPKQDSPDPPPIDNNSAKSEEETVGDSKSEAQEEEEEEGQCGFCLFMRGGGCRERFIIWEKCIEESEKNEEDIAEKCFEVTSALKKCMEAHSDYYAPILEAEKVAEAKAIEELEKEKAIEDEKAKEDVEESKKEGEKA